MNARRTPKSIRKQKGFTLLEVALAGTVLLSVVVGILGVIPFSFRQNHLQGNLTTRTIEYAQDKMESLLGLPYCDGNTDTTKIPAALSTAGTGLGGGMGGSCPGSVTGGATVGGTDWHNPVAGYSDYVSSVGDVSTTAADYQYTRAWSISTDATGHLKTITVVVGTAQPGGVAETTLVAYKTQLQ